MLYVTYIYCHYCLLKYYIFFFFKQKTAYEMRISDWSSDVCSSDLQDAEGRHQSTIAVAQDITSRKVAEQQLQTQSTLLQTVVDSVQDQIGRASCRERVCQYV